MKFPFLRHHGTKPSHKDGLGDSKPAIKPSASAMKEGIATTSKKKLSDCNVLVLDDNADNAELARLYLRKSAKSVDTAETAQEAIEKMQKNKYDIVLSDMSLGGGMTGLDVEKKAKELLPGILYAYATGRDRDGFARMFPGQEYPEHVLQKPVHQADLLEFLNKLLEKQQS